MYWLKQNLFYVTLFLFVALFPVGYAFASSTQLGNVDSQSQIARHGGGGGGGGGRGGGGGGGGHFGGGGMHGGGGRGDWGGGRGDWGHRGFDRDRDFNGGLGWGGFYYGGPNYY